MKKNASYILFLLGMAIIGFLAQFQWVGYIAIGIFTVVALKRRIPARMAFVAALASLAMVPLAIIVSNWLIAQNFSAYSFVLFVVGIILMTVDLQREISSKKYNTQRHR